MTKQYSHFTKTIHLLKYKYMKSIKIQVDGTESLSSLRLEVKTQDNYYALNCSR
jgi:hypothetical protein